MRLYLYIFYFIILISPPLYCQQDDGLLYVLRNREGAGMFSMFGDVLSLVHSYEMGIVQGIKVDFGTEGEYFDHGHGPNWWNYYCEPISIGKGGIIIDSGSNNTHLKLSPIFFYKNREEAFFLIQKHIRFQPHIIQKIQQFKNQFFQDNFVIGVHYRGTDAPESSPSYENYLTQIQGVINSKGISDFRIFVATDEQPFIQFLQESFGDRVCFQEEAFRSNKGGAPVHINSPHNHYLVGEQALIDCALLSHSSFMMLTYSNLSLWASLFNPYIPMLDVSGKLPIVR